MVPSFAAEGGRWLAELANSGRANLVVVKKLLCHESNSVKRNECETFLKAVRRTNVLTLGSGSSLGTATRCKIGFDETWSAPNQYGGITSCDHLD
jgi:hypothetical protein